MTHALLSHVGRLRRVLPLALVALAVLSDSALAQTATEVVATCIDKAADAFVGCVLAEPWYTESLCYAKYAADSLLCVPSTLLKLLSL